MLTFPIKVERTGPGSNLLTIRTTGSRPVEYSTLADIVLGTIGDHNRQTLQFERDPAFESDNLCLVFSNAGSAFPEQSLGQNNEYLIPNALTQESRLSLQIILRENGTDKASSNTLKFALRPAITPGTAPIEPIPDPVQELIGAAFTGVSLEDDEYKFSNKGGAVVATVPAVGGGVGGGTTDHNKLTNRNLGVQHNASAVAFDDGETFQDKYDAGELTGPQGEPGSPGTAATITVGTTTTLPAGSNATVTQGGTPQNAVLNFGIPRGANGSAGGGSGTVVSITPGNGIEVDDTDPENPEVSVSDELLGEIELATEHANTAAENANAAARDIQDRADSGEFDGAPGRDGLNGVDGKDGQQGIQGAPGAPGVDGADGAPGAKGDPGTPGTNGADGQQGIPGVDGKDGKDGAQGPQGEPGQQGAQGVQGERGIQGLPGEPGPAGSTGQKGEPGPAGSTGLQGLPGADGAPGKDGEQGPQGETGPQGATGATGATGAQGPQGVKGDQGPTGPTGSQGPAGTAATVTVGTTITLPAGSNATVTQSGTPQNTVLNFGIPKGADGTGGGGGGITRTVLWEGSVYADGSNSIVLSDDIKNYRVVYIFINEAVVPIFPFGWDEVAYNPEDILLCGSVLRTSANSSESVEFSVTMLSNSTGENMSEVLAQRIENYYVNQLEISKIVGEK